MTERSTDDTPLDWPEIAANLLVTSAVVDTGLMLTFATIGVLSPAAAAGFLAALVALLWFVAYVTREP